MSDKLIGLMAGRDDYLPKPSSYAELLGRVKALLRRYKVYLGKNMERIKENYLEIGGIRIHEVFNEVYVNDEQKDLSDLEYHILLLLMQHSKKIFSAQNLYESVWDEPYFYSCNSTIMVHIRNLRVKIEPDDKNPRYIKTEKGDLSAASSCALFCLFFRYILLTDFHPYTSPFSKFPSTA